MKETVKELLVKYYSAQNKETKKVLKPYVTTFLSK